MYIPGFKNIAFNKTFNGSVEMYSLTIEFIDGNAIKLDLKQKQGYEFGVAWARYLEIHEKNRKSVEKIQEVLEK